MDQSKAPLLDALNDYHRSERYGFFRLDTGRVEAPTSGRLPC